MGKYRRAHLRTVPSLLSLTRVPLAATFPFVVDAPVAAVLVLAVAGASDILDGWYARRFNQATPTGAVIDGVTDKVFVTTVVVTLLLTGRLSWLGLLALSTREIGELPLVAWWTFSRAQRKRKGSQPKANFVGKLATLLQFSGVAFATASLPIPPWLLVLAAVVGGGAAGRYWWREIDFARNHAPAPMPRASNAS